ncbi:MAG: hypothetical protein G01um10143_671 [Parcubacteria group bacterium Gr01-1014_3]|nr:MAG: hypothetical protein G01um10143_671 [Parcubacteria group bacterium Gr01-1014_3]
MADEPKKDLPSDAKPIEEDDIVFNPNEPRGDLGMTMEEAEDYIAKLEAENKRVEAENLRVISHGPSVEDLRVQKEQNLLLVNENNKIGKQLDEAQRESYGLRNREWRSNNELDNRTATMGIVIGAVTLATVVLFCICMMQTKALSEKKAEIDRLTAAAKMPAEPMAVATNVSQPAAPELQTNTEPLTSIYVRSAKLLKIEPAGERWPLIIELDDDRKMRVFVSPYRHYLSGEYRYNLPINNFFLMEHCVIDPTWRDPDSEWIEEPLFKFSLDDYGQKRKSVRRIRQAHHKQAQDKPQRAEY